MNNAASLSRYRRWGSRVPQIRRIFCRALSNCAYERQSVSTEYKSRATQTRLTLKLRPRFLRTCFHARHAARRERTVFVFLISFILFLLKIDSASRRHIFDEPWVFAENTHRRDARTARAFFSPDVRYGPVKRKCRTATAVAVAA